MVVANSTRPNQTGPPNLNLNANHKHLQRSYSVHHLNFEGWKLCSYVLFFHLLTCPYFHQSLFSFLWKFELLFEFTSLSIPPPNYTDLYGCNSGESKICPLCTQFNQYTIIKLILSKYCMYWIISFLKNIKWFTIGKWKTINFQSSFQGSPKSNLSNCSHLLTHYPTTEIK